MERIKTLHPEGKKGVSIELRKYETIKQAILESFKRRDVIPLTDLFTVVEENLSEPFEGSVGWYTMSVKLDLEARGVLERVPKRTPQELRLAKEKTG
jgi:hypothetical protein